MHTLHILSLLAASGGIASARPVSRRSVPHEHAHEGNLVAVRQLLQQNNPGGLGDPVFGLLGAAAAAQGAAGNDPDCLQQLVADQAFSNAKAAGDTQGMIEALVYRTIERNTGKVGLASPLCTAVQAKNPEVAALTQHQDAAGGAATQAANKEIALELARQIASFGGDPQEAIKSGTFAPGDLNDNTGKGGTCDDLDDPAGCIFTRNLLVPDVTSEEIDAAVAGIGGAGAGNQGNAGNQANNGSGNQANQGNQDSQNNAGNNGNNAAAGDNAGIPAPTQNAAAGGGGAATSIQEAAGLTANVELGDCPNIALAFGQNIEGRKETSFIPANLQQFNHGSANNINIITTFMCDQLINRCGLTTADEGHITCKEAAAAIANDPRDGAAADKFNSFFGIQTNFAPIPVVDNQGRTVGAGGAAGNNAVATAIPVPAGNGGNNASAGNSGNNAGSNNAANTAGGNGNGSNNGGNATAGNANAGNNAAAGANLQKFAGGLGVTPPAVTAGGRGFVVANNADFLNLNAALGRSCDVFKNQCANQANSGADFSVSDCESLANQCRAFI